MNTNKVTGLSIKLAQIYADSYNKVSKAIGGRYLKYVSRIWFRPVEEILYGYLVANPDCDISEKLDMYILDYAEVAVRESAYFSASNKRRDPRIELAVGTITAEILTVIDSKDLKDFPASTDIDTAKKKHKWLLDRTHSHLSFLKSKNPPTRYSTFFTRDLYSNALNSYTGKDKNTAFRSLNRLAASSFYKRVGTNMASFMLFTSSESKAARPECFKVNLTLPEDIQNTSDYKRLADACGVGYAKAVVIMAVGRFVYDLIQSAILKTFPTEIRTIRAMSSFDYSAYIPAKFLFTEKAFAAATTEPLSLVDLLKEDLAIYHDTFLVPKKRADRASLPMQSRVINTMVINAMVHLSRMNPDIVMKHMLNVDKIIEKLGK